MTSNAVLGSLLPTAIRIRIALLVFVAWALAAGGSAGGSAWGTARASGQADRVALLPAQMRLELLITDVVRSYDRDAFVTVSLSSDNEESQESVELPGMLAPMRGKDLSEARRPVDITGVNVLIFRRNAFPNEALALIKELASSYGPEPTLSFQPLPKGFKRTGEAGISKELLGAIVSLARERKSEWPPPAAVRTEPPAERPWEKPFVRLVEKTTQVFDLISDDFVASARGIGSKVTWLVGLLLGVMIVCSGVVVFATLSSGRGAVKHLRNGAERIASAIDSKESNFEGGFSRARLPESADASRGSAAPHQTRPDAASPPADAFLASFPAECLLAMMMDSYWTHQDGFANGIWRSLPFEKRQALLSLQPALHAYVSHISRVPAEALGYEHDPYYLSPLPINHLSMDDLAAVVRATPALWGALPAMRKDAMRLNVEERLLFFRPDSRSALASPKAVLGGAPSRPRILPAFSQVVTLTEVDEVMILGQKDIDLEFMRMHRSLVWLLRLSDSQLKELIEPVSARELASAWDAPEPVLQRLEALMPAKKSELLKSYLAKSRPSRHSAAYHLLYEGCMKRLSAPEIALEKAS